MIHTAAIFMVCAWLSYVKQRYHLIRWGVYTFPLPDIILYVVPENPIDV